MKRAVALCPSLTGGKGPEALEVIKHCVGLRPLREGGTRLEKEEIDGIWVVHNYAHGGFGCKCTSRVLAAKSLTRLTPDQCSYGCALAVTDIVNGILLKDETTPNGTAHASD